MIFVRNWHRLPMQQSMSYFTFHTQNYKDKIFVGTLFLGGCTLHYVWEPRAFMTPSKNPIVYERLYV